MSKEFDPEKPVEITMPWVDWNTVLHWLTYGADYHHAKMQEWLTYCPDMLQKTARLKAAEHERELTKAESLAKIIEAALYPAPPKETE